MRRRFELTLATTVALALLRGGTALAADAQNVPPCPSGAEKPDVAALVKRTEQLLDGRSSIGTMTMTIKTPAWSRKLKLKVWARGKDYALVRVVEAGARETGMMTLKREKQLWNYLPQAGRVMKLPSGMLGDSWLGSDFTNDDLVKGSSLTDDFDSTVTGVTRQAGREVWQIQMKPKPSAAVVWGRIEMTIDRQNCLPVTEQFFDEDGKPARRMDFGEFRQIGWRQFPMRMTVTPWEAGRETSVAYEDIQFDVDIPDDTFSLLRLRQGR
jgi:outer membrane lipoprotein-sorting protein